MTLAKATTDSNPLDLLRDAARKAKLPPASPTEPAQQPQTPQDDTSEQPCAAPPALGAADCSAMADEQAQQHQALPPAQQAEGSLDVGNPPEDAAYVAAASPEGLPGSSAHESASANVAASLDVAGRRLSIAMPLMCDGRAHVSVQVRPQLPKAPARKRQRLRQRTWLEGTALGNGEWCASPAFFGTVLFSCKPDRFGGAVYLSCIFCQGKK